MYCSIVFTVPLNVTTVPQSGQPANVKVGEKYQISCAVTGDKAPTTNPWRYSNKTDVKTLTKAGVTVNVVPLQNPTGINSTIIFTKVTKDQLVDYICTAGEGKPNATVTLVKEPDHGKWYV